MNPKAKPLKDDELRPEYDLKTLRVRKVGAGRKLANWVSHSPAGGTRTVSLDKAGIPSKLVQIEFAKRIE